MFDTHAVSRRTALGVVAVAAVGALTAPAHALAPAPLHRRVRRRATGPRLIVVGAGAFGGWTALSLQRAGAQVTLVDAWGAGHSRSSSGDESRVIRTMYNGNETYTRMVQEAFSLWAEAEARWQQPVLTRTGAIYLFEGDDAFATQSIPIMRNLGIPVEEVALADARRRWAQIRFDGIRRAYWEPGAGFLAARASCEMVRQEFVRAGGTWQLARVTQGGIRNTTLHELTLADGSRLSADGYIFACGPWMGQLFPEEIGPGITSTRQEVVFFGTPAGDLRYDAAQCPVWVHFGARRIYGIPGNDRRGFKIADDTAGPITNPTTVERIVRPATIATARALLARRFPGLVDAPVLESRVCQYESSPLGDFLLDRHPVATNVWFAGGGSGHGFKMGPAIGERLRAQVLDGVAPAPIFSYARFAEERTKLTGQRRQHS